MHSFSPGRPHWWQWATILSLDAPAVAVAWQWLFARSIGSTLNWHHHAILATAVWLAYSADRWIEGWRLPSEQVQTQRHHFYQRHRWFTFALWLSVLIASVTLSLLKLHSRELIAGLILLIPVALYLLSHQLVHRHHPLRVPKELCVALLFAGGISVFSIAQTALTFSSHGVLLILFGMLCFADCALISIWEDEVDRQHGQTSLALQYPSGRRLVPWLPWGITLIAFGFTLHADESLRFALFCIAASGVLLGIVDRLHRTWGRQLSRALADLTLLTPAFLWLWLTFKT